MHTSLRQLLSVVLFASLTLLGAPANTAEEIPYLLTAVSKGDLATVNAMLASGASANTKDEDGLTALMYAARKGNAEVVSALIGKGADLNAKDNGGWTPLMFAAKKNHTAVVKVLLEKGADPSVRDSFGWSAFGLAAVSGFPETVEMLVKHGVDVNTKSDDGKSVLMHAAKSGDATTVSILLDNKADILARDRLGTTALMIAAREGHVDVIDAIVKHITGNMRTVVDQKDFSKWTALTWAVKKSQLAAAKKLIAVGANVNNEDDEGTPLLHVAVNTGNAEMVALLLENNAKVKAKDQYGLTALVYALKGKKTDIIKLIKDAGGSY